MESVPKQQKRQTADATDKKRESCAHTIEMGNRSNKTVSTKQNTEVRRMFATVQE